MGDKGHFLVSILKSLIRIIGCCGTYYCISTMEDTTTGVVVFAGSFIIAELLGIIEEVVDGR